MDKTIFTISLLLILIGCDKVKTQADFYKSQSHNPELVGKWKSPIIKEGDGYYFSIYEFSANGDEKHLMHEVSANGDEVTRVLETLVYYTKDNIKYTMSLNAKKYGMEYEIKYRIDGDTLILGTSPNPRDTHFLRLKE